MEKLYNIADTTLKKLTKAGADFGYVMASTTEKHEFNADGEKFTLLRTTYNNSLGLCGYKDHKKGTTNINSFDKEAIDKAVADCISFAAEGKEDEAYAIYPKQDNEDFKQGKLVPDTDKFFKRVTELVKTINKDYPQVLIYELIASYDKSSSVYMNTNETVYTKESGKYSLVLEFCAKEGETVTSLSGTGFETLDLDTPFIEQAMVKQDIESIVEQLNVKALKGKLEDATVIFTPACMAQMLMFYFGTYIGESSVLEKTSPLYDKLGCEVCDKRITFKSAPKDKRIVCGASFSSEGRAVKDTTYIENGVLKAFPISLYTANKTGFEAPYCNSYIPVVEAGEKSIEDIIKETKKGILVGSYSGGHPAGNGDFSGVAKNSFLIEDGRKVYALSEAMISGNLGDMLNNVVDISKETLEDGSMVMPYVACKKIVVAGK